MYNYAYMYTFIRHYVRYRTVCILSFINMTKTTSESLKVHVSEVFFSGFFSFYEQLQSIACWVEMSMKMFKTLEPGLQGERY